MNEMTSVVLSSAKSSNLRQLLETPPEFIELLPMAVYACSADGLILWFNRRAAELWGREPRVNDSSELFCGSYRLFRDGHRIAPHEAPMAVVLRTGEPIQGVEAVVERPDGTKIWAMVHIVPVKDEAGKLVGAINCFHDTSDAHRMGDTLREQKEELEDFFENGAVALHIVSGDGIIVRANKAELDLLGYEPAEYIGHHITEFHADRETIDDILSKLSCGSGLDRFSARLRAKDGSIKHVLITSTPRFVGDRFANTRCFTVDITAAVEARERVAQTEVRYQQLLEALPAAVYTTDAEGRLTYFNKAAAELAGRAPELGKDLWCVTWRLRNADGTPLSHDECPMARTLKEKRAIRNVEAMAERSDGTLVPILPHPTPLLDERGEVVGAVNMLIDISDRKEAENRQIVLLRELNHRVKNNMQLLQALLGGAKRESANAEARAVLADAASRVAVMAAAQRTLYENGRPTSFDGREFLEGVCSAACAAFPNDVRIEIDCADGALSNDVAMPLALILNELLTNAVQHGFDGGGGTIRVGQRQEGDGHTLWVQDSGPGFEFATAARKQSSGLGLVTGLVRQLGGTFSVERKDGARCTVTFEERGE